MNRPVVFLDADVLFAAAAAPVESGASRTVLRISPSTPNITAQRPGDFLVAVRALLARLVSGTERPEQ